MPLPSLPLLLHLLACSSSPDAGDPDSGPSDGGAGVDGGTGADGGEVDGGGGGDDGGTDGGGGGDGGGGDGGGGDGGTASGGAPAVILMIGDGMGFEHVRGGGLYAHGAAGSLVMEGLPVQGSLRTASLSGLTDSAASATVMATGRKTWNGVLGLDAEGVAAPDLADRARALGLAVGIVTSDSLVGATPGAFTVDVSSRAANEEMVAALAAAPPDLMLGGGALDLAGPLAEAGVQVVTDLSLADPADLPLAGLFAEDQLPYVADGVDGVPSLAALTQGALDLLSPDAQGFFLVVEGARIDHASHARDVARALPEVAAFDQAVDAVRAWAEAHPERPVTLVVTADHECGGLSLDEGTAAAGSVPEADWLWGDHTNADVPVFAQGPYTEALAATRLDNAWVHAVLAAALDQAEAVEAPEAQRLVDGALDDLGEAVSTQAHESSFGPGYNQLDRLYLDADTDGLWIGVAGVVDSQANALVVLLDLDYGAGTGLGGDVLDLDDPEGELDGVLSALPVAAGLDGLGFDAAVATLRGTYLKLGDLREQAGLRGFVDPWGSPDDLWWLDAAVNYDGGNMALHGDPAPDAALVGATEGGTELWVPWWALFPDGHEAAGRDLAVTVLLATGDGQRLSNQALPPLASADEPAGTLEISAVAVLSLDGEGVAVGPAVVEEAEGGP